MHCHGYSWRCFPVNNTGTEAFVCEVEGQIHQHGQNILYLFTVGQTCRVACFLLWYSIYMVSVHTEINVAVF